MTCHNTIWLWLLLSATALAGWHTEAWDLNPGWSRYRAEVDDVWFWHNRTVAVQSFMYSFLGGASAQIPECENTYTIFNTTRRTNTEPDPDEIYYTTNYLGSWSIRTARQTGLDTNIWASPVAFTNIHLDGMCADDMTTKTNTDYFADPSTNTFSRTNWFEYTYDAGGTNASASNAYLLSISHSRYGTNYPITLDAKNLMKYDSYYALKERGVSIDKPRFYFDANYLNEVKGGIELLVNYHDNSPANFTQWMFGDETNMLTAIKNDEDPLKQSGVSNIYLYVPNFFPGSHTNGDYTNPWFQYTPADEPSGYFDGLSASDILSDTNNTGAVTNMADGSVEGDYGWKYVDDIIALASKGVGGVGDNTGFQIDADSTAFFQHGTNQAPPDFEGFDAYYDEMVYDAEEGVQTTTNEYNVNYRDFYHPSSVAYGSLAWGRSDGTYEQEYKWKPASNNYTYVVEGEYDFIRNALVLPEGLTNDFLITNVTMFGLCESNAYATPQDVSIEVLHTYNTGIPTDEWFIVPGRIISNQNGRVAEYPMFVDGVDTNSPVSYPTNAIPYPDTYAPNNHTNFDVDLSAGFKVKRYSECLQEYDFEYK